MTKSDDTKTNRLPGGITFDHTRSKGDLFDDGIFVLGTATEQVQQTIDRLFESGDRNDNNMATGLCGTAWLLKIAHEMLFAASEQVPLEEVKS